MSSRLEKYNDFENDSNMSRVKRNEQIYNSTEINDLSRLKTNNNVSVISDATKNINIEKIKKYINDANTDTYERKREKLNIDIPEEKEEIVLRKEEKDFDINSVLEKAALKRDVDYEEERHRKINNVEVDILKNIKVEEKISKIDDDITGPIDELNTQEKTIVDLIQNIQSNSKKEEIFADLMAEDEEDAISSASFDSELQKDNIKEELFNITQDLESIKQPDNEFTQEINIAKELLRLEEEKKVSKKEKNQIDEDEKPRIDELDTSFYTNSVKFDKSDFDGYDELEDQAKKSSFFTKFAVFIIILMLIATILLILNFVFDWGFI